MRPENEKAVALPRQNSVLVNELIQIRVAREYGFGDEAGCRLIRAAPSLYDLPNLTAAKQVTEAEALGGCRTGACALMAALPPYRAFNRSRAGSDLVVGMNAPEVDVIGLTFATRCGSNGGNGGAEDFLEQDDCNNIDDEGGGSMSTRPGHALHGQLALRGPLAPAINVVPKRQRLLDLAREVGAEGRLCVVVAGSFT